MNDSIRYNITVRVESKYGEMPNNDDDYMDQSEVIYFKWDFKRLDKLFSDPEHGSTFKNAIFSVWLKSITDYIVQVDNQVVQKKRENSDKGKEGKHQSVSMENEDDMEESESELSDHDVEVIPKLELEKK